MSRCCVLLLVIAACHHGQGAGVPSGPGADPPAPVAPAGHPTARALGAFDPAAFGAAPTPPGAGRMVDARAGIQAALDAAGDHNMVQLGCGRWSVGRTPGGRDRIASLTVHGRHVTLAGAGPCTVLAPTGDAGHGAWYGIDVRDADDVTIRDLTIDTSGLTNTEEQTHAIQVTGPVDGVRIERVTFDHPRRTKDRVGDCLHLLGNAHALVRNVSVVDVTFAVCARSAIGVQRGVEGLQVVGSRFLDVLKTPIDYEPTSNAGNGALILVGNHFVDTNPGHPGSAAVTIGGFGEPIARVSVTGNVFDRRGLATYRARDVSITGNVFDCDPPAGDHGACLDLTNVAERWVVSDNVIHRHAADGAPASAGFAFRAMHHGQSGATAHAVLGHNIVTQDSPVDAIHVESASDLTIDHNDVTYTAPARRGVAGISLRAASLDVDGIVIDHNRFRATTPGALATAIALNASPASIGNVMIEGNMSIGADRGLTCHASRGRFTAPIVVTGNDFVGLGRPTASSCPAQVATLVTQVQ
jgi:hypothetical protein